MPIENVQSVPAMDYVLPVFSGDFALKYPRVREYFTWEMAESWAKILAEVEAAA